MNKIYSKHIINIIDEETKEFEVLDGRSFSTRLSIYDEDLDEIDNHHEENIEHVLNTVTTTIDVSMVGFTDTSMLGHKLTNNNQAITEGLYLLVVEWEINYNVDYFGECDGSSIIHDSSIRKFTDKEASSYKEDNEEYFTFNKKHTISVDLDSTLFDLLTPWIKYANNKFDTSHTIEDVVSFDQDFLMNSFEFIHTELYNYAVPIDGAVDFIRELQKKYNVQIVTHTFDAHRESKLSFIRKYFGDVKVICTNDCKLDATKGTVLIDDKLEHIEKHADINSDYGIVYSMNDRLKYNITDRKDIPRLGTYKQILEYLEELLDD